MATLVTKDGTERSRYMTKMKPAVPLAVSS
jgi:hypothetical protein